MIELKPGSGVNVVTVDVFASRPIPLGGFDKERLNADVISSSGRRKGISLIRRDVISAADYITRWEELVSARIPTLGSVRLPNPKTETLYGLESVVIGDITADGSELYDKSIISIHPRQAQFTRPSKPLDKTFLTLTTTDNMLIIQSRIEEYMARATEKNIFLDANETFSFIIGPNGNWDIIALDIDPFIYVKNANAADLNAGQAEKFMSQLVNIRESVEKQSKQ